MIRFEIIEDTPKQEVKVLADLLSGSTIFERVDALEASVADLQDKLTVGIVTGQSVPTNETYNGKTVYCKAIDVGSLPNAENKIIPTGLDMGNVNVIRIEGIAQNSNGTTIPLPNTTPSTAYLIGCFVTVAGNIQIDTAIDRSNYTGLVMVYYTEK